MPRRQIKATDIKIPDGGGIVKILGAYSDYEFRIERRTDRTADGFRMTPIFYYIRYGDEDLWKLDLEKDGKYPGWQDDAKEVIVQHSNAKLPKSE